MVKKPQAFVFSESKSPVLRGNRTKADSEYKALFSRNPEFFALGKKLIKQVKNAITTSSSSDDNDGDYDNTNEDIDEHTITKSKESGDGRLPKQFTGDRGKRFDSMLPLHNDQRNPSLITSIDKI